MVQKIGELGRMASAKESLKYKSYAKKFKTTHNLEMQKNHIWRDFNTQSLPSFL